MASTDIDASLSGGFSIKGTRWGREDDKIGIGYAINALSKDHRDFIAAGGLGVLIGDGRLNYSTERVIETYYSWAMNKDTSLTFDYQLLTKPAYNADRGPVSIFAARLRWEKSRRKEKARPQGRALQVAESSAYCEMRRFESLVPIAWNVAAIWLAEVSIQNWSVLLAQFFSSVDIGSPSVLTWMV